MRIIQGNITLQLNKQEIINIAGSYGKVVLDLGAGDGRFVYKNALKHPTWFFIGLDPSAKSLEIYSKKVVKEKIKNVLFAVGSLELLPPELTGLIDEIFVLLPWGSLLQFVVKPTVEDINKLRVLFKQTGALTLIFGYDPNLEPTETNRLQLEPITQDYIKQKIIPIFERAGARVAEFTTVSLDDLKNLESTWGKKIAFGPSRPFFKLELQFREC